VQRQLSARCCFCAIGEHALNRVDLGGGQYLRIATDEAASRLRLKGGVIELLNVLDDIGLPRAVATAVDALGGTGITAFRRRRVVNRRRPIYKRRKGENPRRPNCVCSSQISQKWVHIPDELLMARGGSNHAYS
jgi:hypothetical protein